MSNTDKAQTGSPAVPAPIESPVTMRDLAAILVKHYDLHEGRYDLLVEYQIGMGAFGPDPASTTPGAMIGISKVGLMPAQGDGPTSVDAAIVNPKQPSGVKRGTAPKRQGKARTT
jgi:hypothetical protein